MQPITKTSVCDVSQASGNIFAANVNDIFTRNWLIFTLLYDQSIMTLACYDNDPLLVHGETWVHANPCTVMWVEPCFLCTVCTWIPAQCVSDTFHRVSDCSCVSDCTGVEKALIAHRSTVVR